MQHSTRRCSCESCCRHCMLCLLQCNMGASAAGAADPFAVRGGGAAQGPPSSPAAPGGPEPVRPTGDINDWFRKLCQSPSGVLYEDNYLQASIWPLRSQVLI